MRAAAVALAFCSALALAAAAAADAARPNFVFILSDDHRWDALGAAGNREIHTPNLDRLAREGVHFLDTTIAVPLCSPSRAALLTGTLPHQNGYYSNKSWSSDAGKGFSAPTALERLQSAGYRTALVGKWHLKPKPWKCGVDEPLLWMPQGADNYTNAELARGKDDDTKKTPGDVTTLFTDSAIGFLKRADSFGQPFFLWLAYTAPHTPQKPVPEHIAALYRNYPPEARPPGFPPGEKTEAPWAQYYSAVSHLDEQLGRVLAALDETGLARNTVVVFLGDNGWLMGSHGYYGKILPFEESVRVPLIVRAPPQWQRASGPSRALVSSLDVTATWLDLAGAAPLESAPGRSLRPLLENPAAPFRTELVAEFEDEDDWPGLAYRLIRTADWKYVLRPPRSAKQRLELDKRFAKAQEKQDYRKPPPLAREELFHLKSDPFETRSWVGEDAAQEPRADLRERLRAFMQSTDDPALRWLHTNRDDVIDD